MQEVFRQAVPVTGQTLLVLQNGLHAETGEGGVKSEHKIRGKKNKKQIISVSGVHCRASSLLLHTLTGLEIWAER